jgi:ATP-binding cassette subfamily B protein
VVKAFAQEATAVQSFEGVNRATRDASIRATTVAFLVMPMMTVLTNADIAVVAGLGGWLAIRGLASVGTIVSFVSYARQFARPLRQLANLYNSVQSALAGAERVFEVIDQRPGLADEADATTLDDVCGDVVFDQVDFSYVPGVPVLKKVSFHAEPSSRIAFVGPTGAGKTTMVNLLSRFYDVDSGSIRIDGHDVRELRLDSLRRKLGTVLQDTFLFSDTVMENIRYGRLDATDEECMQAARLANADQFIHRLPEGYQTELSERASNLSLGQRQLLSIARAVLSNPAILILDEATSSVDTRTEAHIQQALLRLMEGRTSFVIAHRLSTIRNADLVLVINDGEIVERGAHEELLAQRGFYYELYMSQFKGTNM